MRNIFFIISLTFFINIAFSVEKDSIFIKLIPDTLYSGFDDTIYCKIYNKGFDTLVFMNEFYSIDLADGGFPMDYSPNIIFFYEIGKYNIIADSRYKTSYFNFPMLGIILPNSEITIIITCKSENRIFSQKNWMTSCVMSLSKKSVLDSIVNLYYRNRILEYIKSIKISNTYISEMKHEMPPESHDNNEILDMIKNAFDLWIQDFRFK